MAALKLEYRFNYTGGSVCVLGGVGVGVGEGVSKVTQLLYEWAK